ncbi:hypothetical protein CBS101457_005771 [Exobasidium rhododendri]|nr:hypothetical protein CBS101457_005771 [Exobasidium rhododendri]
MTTMIPILHFNDVYRVKQTSRSLGGTITADQFAAKISTIRTSWGESSRALDFLSADKQAKKGGEESQDRDSKQSPFQEGERPLKGLVLFSGDVFNPSIESSVTRGEHMVDVLNACSIDCACLGNHDFDFGYPHLRTLMQQTNFPWTFTNIADVGDDQAGKSDEIEESDKQVEGTLRSWVCEVEGVRIGCIGLVERDWIATVPSFPPTFRYRSMVAVARKLSKELRDPKGEQRCDIVIALTHCRLPNDIDLANELGATKSASSNEHGVDLVLGGHDHTYYIGKGVDEYKGEEWHTDMPGLEKDTDCLLVKSGTDFHDLSEIKLEISREEEGKVRRRRIVGVKVQRHSTKPSDPTFPELKEHIDELIERVDNATGQAVAFSLTPLDCRMEQVRTEESATGNLIADILMHSYEDAIRERDRQGDLAESRSGGERQVDMTLICGGSLRGDAVFGPGTIALRDVLSIMPFEDSIVVKELKGQDVWDALESGFGAYPSQEGRFPQVAGLSILWDSSKPSGKRLIEVHLLEDVHLFHPDGSKKKESEVEAEEKTSYAFQRSEEGGYSVDVNRPKIRKGNKLEMGKTYRVCTREYMAAGHDGYEALSRGKDIVDHESGSLMSTLVRKYLLGASLIWRLKAFRDNTDESGKGAVGRYSTLSSKTRRAVERANALCEGQQEQEDVSNGHARKRSHSTTPSSFDPGSRVVIDSSPGGIRDAIHAGASEHHSEYDAASKLFKGGSRVSRNTPSADDKEHKSNDINTQSSTTYSPRDSRNVKNARGVADEGNNGDVSTDSQLFFRRHLDLSPQDAEELRKLEGDLAVIAPLIDGRMVNVARTRKAKA